jgi:hypothetical protein
VPVYLETGDQFDVHGFLHRKYIPIYIQQDATLHSLLYLETALHVSGVASTHHQERIRLYLQHLVFVTPLPLSAAIVDELELRSNSSTHHQVFVTPLPLFAAIVDELELSSNSSTHHQERIRLYLQHLLFAAIVDELELRSNSSTIAADNSNGVTNTRCCKYSRMRS